MARVRSKADGFNGPTWTIVGGFLMPVRCQTLKDLSLFASEDIFSPPSKQIKFSESTTETTKQKQPTVRTLLTSPVSSDSPRERRPHSVLI